MIKGHFGVNGSGKSYDVTQHIIEDLRTTDRHIITNHALKVPETQALFDREFPHLGVRVRDRVTFLDDDSESAEFYLVRPYGFRALRPGKGCSVDYSSLDCGLGFTCHSSQLPPVSYYIDEAYFFFGAREWQGRGQTFFQYLNQHRKFSDDVHFISPADKDLDSKLRDKFHEVYYYENLRQQQFGRFRKPAAFTRKLCLKIGDQHPMRTDIYAMKRRITDCYETAKGVGVRGGKADTVDKSKGLHWVWLLVVLVLLGVGLWILPNVLVGGVIGGLDKMSKSGVVTNVVLDPKPQKVVSGPESVKSAKEETAHIDIPRVEKDPVWLTGIGSVGSVSTLWFSDGTKLTSGDLSIDFIGVDRARVRGRVYRVGEGAPVSSAVYVPPAAAAPGGSVVWQGSVGGGAHSGRSSQFDLSELEKPGAFPR